MASEQLFGIDQGYLVLEFGVCQALSLRLHRQRSELIADPNAYLAAIGNCDQSVRDLLPAADQVSPTVVVYQELSLYLDGHALSSLTDPDAQGDSTPL